MHTIKLTSLQHPVVKHLKKLRTDKAYRHSEGRLFILGENSLREIEDHVSIKRLLCTKPSNFKAEETYLVTEEIIKKISGVTNPEPLAAEVQLPPFQDLRGKKRLLGLDHLRDPGNVGTLIRTALAFNFDGVVLDHSVDPFNDKALRAAKGATFKIPLSIAPLSDHPQPKLIADLDGAPLEDYTPPESFCLILGSESHGPSSGHSGDRLTIPMSGKIDSLNVALAGAILMYALS
ncbi:MAG: RNA methyltransferase [Simkaniaceae bacterium]